MPKKILLASPRGFCAGVERAIKIVERALKKYGKPIYVRHQIVHNEFVVKSLEQKGVIFIESLSQVPKGTWVILSAHGSPPEVIEEAKKLGLKYIDAACPLVIKVHKEAERYNNEGYTIILIGHKSHQEVIGTMGYAPMHLIENVKDVEKLNIKNHKIAVITQTTLSMDDIKEIMDAIRKKFPYFETAPKQDICYATTNRQNAVKELAKQAKLILIIGSDKSSNSLRLAETAKRYGSRAFLIHDKSSVRDEWLKDVDAVGITSGASAPEILVQELVQYLMEKYDCQIETIHSEKENMHFPLPKEVQT